MQNLWTYRQYTLFRILFGAYIIVHFSFLLPWGTELFSNQGMLPSGSLSPLFNLFPNILLISDSPLAVLLLLLAGIASGVCLMAGKYDRLAALFGWYALTSLFDRNPFIANPSLPYVGWLLLAHAFMPRASTENSSWRMPSGIFLAAWVAMAAGYTYSGYTKLISESWVDGSALEHVLHNPLARANLITHLTLSLPDFCLRCLTWGALILELSFAPLALFTRVRPWIWLLLLGMHLGLLCMIRFADLSFGMIMLHLFTFNPAWIRPKQKTLHVFYDGTCGFCHSFVRFTLSENICRSPFVFSPLQGKKFQELVKNHPMTALPDSIAVYDPQAGIIHFKTAALIMVWEGLGGLWRCFAFLLKLVPQRIGDLGYDSIAKVRHRLFPKPHDACPMLPQEWKQYLVND